MRKFITLLCAVLIVISSLRAQERIIAKGAKVITGHLVKITSPIRDFRASQSPIRNVKVRNNEGIVGEKEEFEEGPNLRKIAVPHLATDPVLQKNYPNFIAPGHRQVTGNFNGMPNSNVSPADPSMAAGPNHIIQMMNGSSGALFSIYDKTGVQLVAPTYLDNITGKGGLGDPIVLYDQLADRFMMTEFVNKNEAGSQGLSIAISQTNDPTGSWYIYFFSTGTIFPDYPKFSVWTDAYYAKTNDFNTSNYYVGSTIYAFDRTKMLAGNATASMQQFTTGSSNKDYSMVPVSLQGTTPPAVSTGGLLAYMQDNSWTGAPSDSIGLVEFKVDFSNSGNSRIITNSSLAAAYYSPNVCGASRSQCIPQPTSNVLLEAIDQRIMNQPVYRNFGTYEGIVFTNVVDKGSNIAGVRWYELIKTASTWSINQQSTYSPDSTHRFMPSVCYDATGNIGLAYNVSSSSVYPGIRYTGRKQCDSLNTMTYSEGSIVEGTASNKNSRYGDYNHLVCDPDGHTFWFTAMYNSGVNWSTRIASFTLDTCDVRCGMPSALSSSNITSSSAILSWTGVPNAVTYSIDYKLNNSSTWINASANTSGSSINLQNLSDTSVYDWRVKVNCLPGSGDYINAQLTTLQACNPPSGLASSNISANGATVSWVPIINGNSYSVDYRLSGSSTWTNAVIDTTSTSVNLAGLSAGSIYEWRVGTSCTGNTSSYSTGAFLTTPSCTPPSALTSSNITASGAAVSWSAVPGANIYSVDYKATTSSTWISATAGTSSLSVYLTLSANTLYDWRVKANCLGAGSNYNSAQLRTLSTISCNPPGSLASSALTTTSALVAWGSVNGASNYSLDYKLSTSTTWINAVAATTLRSFTLTGLSPATVYNWRVRTKCTASSSAYANAQFATLQICNAPSAIASANISASGVTLSWTSVTGASTYAVDYKKTTTTTWTSATSSTTATSINLATLSASTIYDWRVKSNCTGNSSSYNAAQFTTAAICPDQYESNNTLAAAKAIPLGTDIRAQVASTTDLDFYSFSNTTVEKNIKVTLTNLPADYDVKLFDPAGVNIATAQTTGLASETINYNAGTVGIYKVEVYGKSKAYNATACYTLRVQIGSTGFAPGIYRTEIVNSYFLVYPNPASQQVSLSFEAYNRSNSDIIVTDQFGNTVISKTIVLNSGPNFYDLDVSKLANGVYYIRVTNLPDTKPQKLVIAK